MIIDADSLDAVQSYKLLIATVVPRAIGWISTLSTDGVANLAPFSFFTVVGRKPAVLSISMQHRTDGTEKDTFVNIRDTGEFVANLVTLPTIGQMHQSAAEHPPEVDEFVAVGLEKAACEVVKAPRVAVAPVAMECKLDRLFTVGDFGDHVIWGRIVRFHISDDLYLPGGRFDTAALGIVGRLAAEYTLVENVFTTPVEPSVLAAYEGRRMERLDGKPSDYSAVAQPGWSANGATKTE